MDSFPRQKLDGETREEYLAALQQFVAQSVAREFPKPLIPPKPNDAKKSPTAPSQPKPLAKQPLFGAAATNQPQPERYKKTGGAADGAGESYECKILTIVLLRLISSGLEFKLASNFEAAGLFDDVVVKYRQRPDDPWTISLLQLKHKQKRAVSKSALLGIAGDFSLLKYGASYAAVKCSFPGRFVIFTNASVGRDLVDEAESDRLLSVGGLAVSFKAGGEIFRELCEWVDFKETLTELHGQVDGFGDEEAAVKIVDVLTRLSYENKAVATCKEELRKSPTLRKLGETLRKLEIVGDKETYAAFLAELRVYADQAHESELDAKIAEELGKVWTCGDDSESGVMTYALKDKVRSWWQKENVYLTQDSTLWLEVVEMQTDALSRSTAETLSTIRVEFHESCLQVLRGAISRPGITNLRVDSRTAASSLKVRQALGGCGWNVLHVNVKALLAREDDVFSAWATRWCPVLVLDCNEGVDGTRATRIAARVTRVLARDDGKKRLVLIAPENHALNSHLYHATSYTYFNDNFVWSDLTDESKDRILSKSLVLNGIESQRKLSELLGDDEGFVNKVDLEVMSQLLQGDLACGNDLDGVGEVFVTRRLQLADDVPFVVDSLRDVGRKTVLLVAEPGMGKSTLLTHLAKSAKSDDPSTWVVLVRLNDRVEFLREMEAERFDELAAKRFLEQCVASPGNRLQKLLLGALENKLVVFVDGVDEVCPYYEQQVFALLSFLGRMSLGHLWVTSRPVFQTKLQHTLGVPPHRLVSFSSEDRVEFFDKVRKARVPSASSGAAVNGLLSWLHDSLGKDNPILGIPLMNAMIAEMFRDWSGSEKHEPLDVVNLYRSFVKKKFDLYNDEKKKTTSRELAATKHDEAKLLREIHRNHRLAALRVLFGVEEISGWQFEGKERFEEDLASYLREVSDGREKMGIVDDVVAGLPRFIHRSFAEYFAATWLVDNFKTNRTAIERVIFNPSYKLVAEMFDRLLAENHPLHVAVCNGDLEATERVLTEKPRRFRDLDDGGRTPLHLAALLGGTAIVRLLLDGHEAWLEVRDEVLGWVPQRCAEIAGAWGALGLILGCLERVGRESLLQTSSDWPKPDSLAMLGAARDADVTVVRYLVKERGGKLSCRGPNGETMMHAAVEGGNVDVINHLLKKGRTVVSFFERGVDLDAVDDRGLTAVQVAAQKGMYHAVAALLGKKVSYDVGTSAATETQLSASLLCAAYAGNLASVKTLLDRGAYAWHRDDDGHTAAWVALRREFSDISDLLLAHGSDKEDTSLHTVCRRGDLELVSILWLGADLESKGRWGHTPLAAAASGSHVAVMEFLLERGANVECGDKDGWTPLHFASSRGNVEMAGLLLRHGANVNSLDNGGRTAIHVATSTSVAMLLLEEGAEVNCLDVDDRTPLHYALSNENETSCLLLSNGADVTAADNRGQVPLHAAASSGNVTMVTRLLELGASVDCGDKFGMTALHYASLKGSVKVTDLLLRRGVNVSSVDGKGRTALHIASSYDNEAVATLLLERGAKVDCRDKDNWTPLHHVSWKGSDYVARLLLLSGADVNVRDNMARTPLALARMCRHSGVLDLLTDFGEEAR